MCTSVFCSEYRFLVLNIVSKYFHYYYYYVVRGGGINIMKTSGCGIKVKVSPLYTIIATERTERQTEEPSQPSRIVD